MWCCPPLVSGEDCVVCTVKQLPSPTRMVDLEESAVDGHLPQMYGYSVEVNDCIKSISDGIDDHLSLSPVICRQNAEEKSPNDQFSPTLRHSSSAGAPMKVKKGRKGFGEAEKFTKDCHADDCRLDRCRAKVECCLERIAEEAPLTMPEPEHFTIPVEPFFMPGFRFWIRLDRSQQPQPKLGVHTGLRKAPAALRIIAINSGLIMDWNLGHPEKRVELGDLVVAVDDAVGDLERMCDALMSPAWITLSIYRPPYTPIVAPL